MKTPELKIEEAQSVEGDVGFFMLPRGGACDSVDFTKPETVGAALSEIAQASINQDHASCKATGIFLKSASIGFEAALADMIRHDYSPKDGQFAAINACAQFMAFLVGTIARQNGNSDLIVAEKIATISAAFCEVFCPMAAKFSGAPIDIRAKTNLTEFKEERSYKKGRSNGHQRLESPKDKGKAANE